MISGILDITGKISLSYVGHSMGTTAYLIFASSRPEKIQFFGLLASQKDSEKLARICHHAKTSKISVYIMLHYAQNITNKVFQAFDQEDSRENMKRYGSELPSPRLPARQRRT